MAGIIKFKNYLNSIKKLGIDSSIFIYKFEQNKKYEPLCSFVFEKISYHQLTVITSIITVAEVLAKPIEKRDIEIIELYETMFCELPNFELVDLDYSIAKQSAILRAKYNILLPDAFQISAALKNKAEIFLTNDLKLKKVKEIKILCLQDFVSF